MPEFELDMPHQPSRPLGDLIGIKSMEHPEQPELRPEIERND